jgi:hypothetical protein
MTQRQRDWRRFVLVLLVALMVQLGGCGAGAPAVAWKGVRVEAAQTPECVETSVEAFVAVDEVTGSLYSYLNLCERYVLVCVSLPFWVTTPCARLDFTDADLGWGITSKPPMSLSDDQKPAVKRLAGRGLCQDSRKAVKPSNSHCVLLGGKRL